MTVKIKRNARQKMDGLVLLAAMPRRSVALAFFDPQYRDVLDRQNYGNEGERQKERADLPQMDGSMIAAFLDGIENALRPSGHIALWIDKFALVTGCWRDWLPDTTSIASVDMMVWDKQRIGMGRRFRSRAEYMLVLQKGPLRAGDCFKDHGMADVWPQKAERGRHVHAKPIEMMQRFILSTTEPGDLVLDPAAGSYTVLDACRATAREFVGCDLI